MKVTGIILALLVGAGVGFGFATAHSRVTAKSATDENAALQQKLAAAEKRVGELQKQLSAAKVNADKTKQETAKKIAALKKKAQADGSEASKKDEDNNAIVLGKDGDIAEALKKRLPSDQFAQVTNAFSQLRARLARRAKGRQDYLASIDVSNMTADEKANHTRYLELFAKREAASAKMRGGIPDPASIQEVVKIGMEMQGVAKAERATLMRQVTRELGYSGEDARTIEETVQNIYDCTNAGPMSGLNDMVENAASLGGMGEDSSDVKIETQIIGL